MNKLITLAVFDNAFDIKFNLLKDMLQEANIKFDTTNEFRRSVGASIFAQSNVGIEVRVFEKDIERALEIKKSII